MSGSEATDDIPGPHDRTHCPTRMDRLVAGRYRTNADGDRRDARDQPGEGDRPVVGCPDGASLLGLDVDPPVPWTECVRGFLEGGHDWAHHGPEPDEGGEECGQGHGLHGAPNTRRLGLRVRRRGPRHALWRESRGDALDSGGPFGGAVHISRGPSRKA